MKNVLLISGVMLFAAFGLPAQTEAGKVLIGTSTNLYTTNRSSGLPSAMNGGGISFSSSKQKADSFETGGTNLTSFNLAPRFGFFAADGLLLGLGLSFSVFDSEVLDENIVTTEIGPFVRYYFISQSSFKPFVQAGLNIGQLRLSSFQKNNLLDYGAGIGGAFFLSDQVAVDLLLNYVRTRSKDKDAVANVRTIASSFGLGVGLSVFL